MIKASELRIGNLIELHHPDKGVRIWEVSAHDLEEIEGYGEDCFPIPLTEEWLLKAGFAKRISYHKTTRPNKSLEISWNDGDKYYAFFRNWFDKDRTQDEIVGLMDDLRYVHQLQNLYFILAGEELPALAIEAAPTKEV